MFKFAYTNGQQASTRLLRFRINSDLPHICVSDEASMRCFMGVLRNPSSSLTETQCRHFVEGDDDNIDEKAAEIFRKVVAEVVRRDWGAIDSNSNPPVLYTRKNQQAMIKMTRPWFLQADLFQGFFPFWAWFSGIVIAVIVAVLK